MPSQDEKIRQMLDELGHALAEAIVRSEEVNGAMRRICDEGYSLYLLLDLRKGRTPGLDTGLAAPARKAPLPASRPPAPALPRPSFRLNSQDVEFLKSIGIDPTRSARRRRGSSR